MKPLWLCLALVTVPVLADPPEHGRGREEQWERHEEKRERQEDRREARHERKEERREERREERDRHHFHEREADRDRHDHWDFDHPHHSHRAPQWSEGYWRPGQRRYMALVPNDPSRVYVYLDGAWVLRRIKDANFRLDVQGAYELPEAPPPAPLPRIGLKLKIVLFD